MILSHNILEFWWTKNWRSMIKRNSVPGKRPSGIPFIRHASGSWLRQESIARCRFRGWLASVFRLMLYSFSNIWYQTAVKRIRAARKTIVVETDATKLQFALHVFAIHAVLLVSRVYCVQPTTTTLVRYRTLVVVQFRCRCVGTNVLRSQEWFEVYRILLVTYPRRITQVEAP